ncbi:protein-tyrosine phosphatase-like protein [Dendryphion nanum]|uniref:Protein-tyrosine phosphatase-like protein n=1 Tax=Dendryphion nanum TaxID=256645 RepID=A0A9P9E5S9_9PLEO|nr:protein-tyrosine phosphatase-like protein [Dendryphion nanum]
MSDSARPPLSIPNFRDAGAFLNKVIGRIRIKPGMVYRSGRPDDASFQDRQRLRNTYKLRTIIDLRTKTEHVQQAQKRDTKIKSSPAALQSNDEAAEPVKIPGINYYEINFNGTAFNKLLLWKLSWWELVRLVTLMVFGYRNEAIQILAPTMNTMGLVGIAKSLLEVSKPEIRQVFEIYSEERNYPVLVHCTQGKDRTGLVVMLLLGLLSENSLDAIEKDYLISEKGLESEKNEMLKELEKVGLSAEFTACDPDMVKEVFGHIHEKYGSIETYLESCGVGKEMQEKIRSILCCS